MNSDIHVKGEKCIPYHTSSARVRDDHPPDEEVEEEHGVGGQELPPLGLAVAQELHGGVGGPQEADHHGGGADDEEHGALGGQKDHPTVAERHILSVFNVLHYVRFTLRTFYTCVLQRNDGESSRKES